MATVTLPLASFAAGAVSVSAAYDDQTLAVSTVEWANTTAYPAPVKVTPPHGRVRTFTLAAGQSGSVDVSKFGLALVQEADGGLTFGWQGEIGWGA